jgi:hypothetical protein
MGAGYQDWSLERKGHMDQARHLNKIREAIQEHLDTLITEEALVTSAGERTIRVPIKSLEEFKFRYDPWAGEHVGQGPGSAKPGDVLGRIRPSRQGDAGDGHKAGEAPGEDVYEVEVSVEDLAAILFEQLELPDLRPKGPAGPEVPSTQFRDISKVGLMGNLDKRRTLRQNLMRRAREGSRGVGPIARDDLRFKMWTDDREDDAGAVVIAMRDVSGSMGDFKKLMARAFYFWMIRFLRTRYRSVAVVFVVHHTQAREVDEDTFFRLGENGGTKVSSAYELCRDVIQTRYPPSRWNVYAFHFSDGDNWSDADNRRTVEILGDLLPLVNAFGYAEIREGGYTSTLMTAFHGIHDPRFRTVAIANRRDVLEALRHFFHRGGEARSS